MKTHKVKILAQYAMIEHNGFKPWELRKNDRNYKAGDKIEFQIVDENGQEFGGYMRKITYVFEGGRYGLEEGYCILSLAKY